MARCRLYFDHDVSEPVARQLQREGSDIVIAKEIGYEEVPDAQVLEYAAIHQRVLVTHNRFHFRRLHRMWIRQRRHHWGILAVSHRISRWMLEDALREFLQMFKDAEMVDAYKLINVTGEVIDRPL